MTKKAMKVQAAAYAVLVMLVAALVPGRANAVKETEAPADPCSAAAWADYNDCLLRSRNFIDRALCDVVFMVDIVVCTEKYARESIR